MQEHLDTKLNNIITYNTYTVCIVCYFCKLSPTKTVERESR